MQPGAKTEAKSPPVIYNAVDAEKLIEMLNAFVKAVFP